MCDVQPKLVAWLDKELAADEATEVERHLEQCKECQRWVATYGQVSETFDACCDAVMAAKAPRRVPRWVPALASSLVAASVLLVAFLRTHVAPPSVLEPTVATASAAVAPPSAAAEAPLLKTRTRRRHMAHTPRVQERPMPGEPMDTAIQIAIPAEAMFPPGAMPSGINFIADVRIAPDGSVQQIRLRQ